MRIEPTLRALADPTRLRIMRLLAAMELAVGELALVLGQSQPRVSRHIKILCDAGLAERRKEGAWVFLRSAIGEDRAPPLGAAAARLLATAEQDDAQFAARCAEDRRHLAAIRAARETSAQAYFARHAAEWDELRGLHSPDGPYLGEVQQAATQGFAIDDGHGHAGIASLGCRIALPGRSRFCLSASVFANSHDRAALERLGQALVATAAEISASLS